MASRGRISMRTSSIISQSPIQQEGDGDDQSSFLGFCSFCVELVGGTGKKQNWKGLGIAFLVIGIICLFIAGAIVLTTNKPVIIQNDLIAIKEEDILKIKIPKPWNGTWISDRSFSYPDKNNSIWIYHCQTLKQELVLRRDMIQEEILDEIIVSPSAKYFLLPIRKEKIRSYYTEYQYVIYEKSKIILDEKKLSTAAIVYSHSDALFAFIQNFDVYIYDIPKKITSRITFDGNRELIHNGLVEWIYEYEIFNQHSLLFWSPTDRYLAFIKINLTNLPKNSYLKYDLTRDNSDFYSIPYPKYHDSLPFLDVYIFHLRSGKTFRIPRSMEYVYIYHIVWYTETCLAVVYSNRQQNLSMIELYEIVNEKIIVKGKYLEETRRGVALARFLKPYFSANGTFAYIIRFDSSNNERANSRVVRIDFNQTHPQIDVKSPGEMNADEIIHVNQFGQVYFTGFPQTNLLEKHLYRWTYTTVRSDIECLSCNESCGYVNAQFSLRKGSFYILECFGPDIPFATLHNRIEKLAIINQNEPFRDWTNSRLMPYIDYFSVPLDGKNTVGNGMIILPPNYNANITIASYPVIISINDRLDDQRVNKKYPFFLPEFFQVIENNLSIVLFDAHGSRGQDERYSKNNFQDWFKRQYEDYIKLAHHLKWNEKKFNDTLSDIRFGLLARGPAAVIALKLLEESNRDEYKCALLQSPVFDLSHYHAIFSERINGLKPITPTVKSTLRNKTLAFVHGTADEVVHFKHSAVLAKSLTHAGIPFEFKVYPDVNHHFDEDHLIYSNFFQYQQQFFHQCLGGRINKERKIIIPDDYD